jgi:signal transduction histidine kinase
MAAPLVHDGSVRGVLYVGNRHATPFSDTDERMLEEFADLVALLMGEPDYRPAVRAAQTARLREDFAHSIHDSVVRSLVHIGFTAEQASAGMRADDAARTISVIRSAAEDALANLRAELGGLTMDAGAGTTHIGEIVDQITDVPVRPGAERTVRVSADTADRTLPAGIADAVAQIGAEALTNAVLHSDATNEAVRVDHTETSVELTISDDGRGSPALRLGRDELGPAGHFGLQSMYRRAAGVGGHLEITSDDDGTVVHLSVPRTW